MWGYTVIYAASAGMRRLEVEFETMFVTAGKTGQHRAKAS